MASFFFFAHKYVSVNSILSFVFVTQFLNPFTTWSNSLVPACVIRFDYLIIEVITGVDTLSEYTICNVRFEENRYHKLQQKVRIIYIMINENLIISNFGCEL